MNNSISKEAGWKPIPLSLKILFVGLTLWIIGSLLAISQRYELGLPFFGFYIYGISASLMVIFLDVLAPITFLFGLWTRKSWAPMVAYLYMEIFLINGIIAIFIFREQLGLAQILIPNIAELIFLIIVYRKRSYFINDKGAK